MYLLRGAAEAAKSGAKSATPIAALLFLISMLSGLAFADDPNPVPKVPKGDVAMMDAFAHAAAGLDGFLSTWRDPPRGAKRFSVKIGLMDASGAPGYVIVRPGVVVSGRVEWFWTHGLRADGAGFTAGLIYRPLG